MAVPRLEASKDCDMKKKLLVLLIAVIPTMMPNLASAVAIEVVCPESSGNMFDNDSIYGECTIVN